MRTFVEELIAEKSKTELDLEFPYYDGSNPNKVLIPDSHLAGMELPSMDLNEAILILQSMKVRGANRVYFSASRNHQGYYFYGTQLKEIQ